MNDKIQKALKLYSSRDQSYLIQFWLYFSVGNCKSLKIVGHPFGLGIHNQGLCNYRSQKFNEFLVHDECKEEDLIPIVRVFRRGLPEWTSDVRNYDHAKMHPLQDLQDFAIHWNLHGYLVLPVFDSITMLCVGVLELVTSTKYLDCAYEVQQVHQTLKEANLTSPQAFDCPISYVDYKNRQHELDEIFKVLKDVCHTHKLPLAQTWSVSSRSSFVATKRNIEMTCSSFNARCIGKVCLSTTGLPFYVPDLRFWQFREACREHHLLKSDGVVGRAFSSHGSCFCADLTKLGEDEYSLVYNARMNGLTSCFAIYLHSSEHDDIYVLEFFMPVHIKEDIDLCNLVQTMKMQLKFSSLESGDLLSTKVIGIPMESSQLSLTMQLIDTSWSREILHQDSKEKHTTQETNDYDEHDLSDGYPMYRSNAVMNTEGMLVDDATSKKLDIATENKRACSNQKRKRKIDSITPETIQQYFGKPIGEASKILGVSRSTVKRVCRELNITSWPMPYRNKKYSHFGVSVVALLLIRVKRWVCWSNLHGFSARWWICGKHNAFVCKSNPSANISQLTMTPNESIVTTTSFSKPSQTHFGVSPKTRKVVNVFDTRMVTVKATFQSDMIKFQCPISSGVSELKKQVAQRINLKSTRLCLKYRDEDDDLILISCDADFHNLTRFSASSVTKNTIKLIVQMAND